MANKRPRFPNLSQLNRLFDDDLFIIRDSIEGFDREITFKDLADQICQHCRGIKVGAKDLILSPPAAPSACLEAASLPWPTGLTPDANLDARLPDTLTLLAGNLVSRWEAEVDGHLFFAEQATGANQPLYIADGLNGCPCIEFDDPKYLEFEYEDTGGNQLKGLGLLPSSVADFTCNCADLGRGTGITVMAVIQQTQDPAGVDPQNIIWWHPTAAVHSWIALGSTDTRRLRGLAARIRTGTPTDRSAPVGTAWAQGYEGVVGITGLVSGTSGNRVMKFWKDAAKIDTSPTISGGSGSFLIGISTQGSPCSSCVFDASGLQGGRIGAGAFNSTVSEFFLGRIGQIAIWNSELSEANAAIVGQHMLDSWGL